MKNTLLLRGVLQMALWSLPVEALSATLGLPRTLGYWPLTIGVGSMDEEPEPQTMFLKVLGSLSDTGVCRALGTESWQKGSGIMVGVLEF